MSQIKTKFIQDDAVTNAKLAEMATLTVKGNNTGGSANPIDLTVSQTQTLLSIPTSSSPLPLASGGTGVSAGSANVAFNTLSPLTTKGDILSFSTVNARLPVGTDGQVLTADSAQTLGVKWATVTASGTVTDVSVVTANGVSGSVATSTTTPAITLTLGAITPSSVASTGTVTGTNLSGTNTGDVTLAAFGSSPSANAASLSGQVLTLQPADLTHPGGVSIGTQTFGGVKIFDSAPAIKDTSAAFTVTLSAASSSTLTSNRTFTIDTNNVSSTLKMGANLTVTATATVSGTNTGDITLAAVGASPNANGATLSGQVLNLEKFSSTQPGVVSASGGGTTNFLRADGTWNAPTGSSAPRSSIILFGGNGHGSTNTTVRRFTTAELNTGSDMTLSQGTAGDTITINTAGVYNFVYSDRKTSSTMYMGITVNGSALTTSIIDQTYAQGKRALTCTPNGDTGCCSTTLILAVNDVVRFQDDGSADNTNNRTLAIATMVSF